MSHPTSFSIPTTQKAWRVVRQGKPATALELHSSAPVPTSADLKDGEVLVKVGAAALNPVGYGLMKLPNFIARRPWDAAENDLSGTVVLSKSSLHKPGDKVYGFIDVAAQMSSKQGALIQYTRMPGELLVRRPDHIKSTDAAGITLTGNTAYQALFEVAKLEEGQTVFINGGSSSVGAYAIQFAKAKGLKVWTSASGKNEEYVKGLGADVFLDYTKEPLYAQLERNPPSPKFHALIDAVGLFDPSLFVHSEAYLAPTALFANIGSTPSFTPSGIIELAKFTWAAFLRPTVLGGTKRKMVFVGLKPSHERMVQIGKLFEEGKVKPLVDSVHEFDDVLKAYERIMTKRARGKVVVSIDPEA